MVVACRDQSSLRLCASAPRAVSARQRSSSVEEELRVATARRWSAPWISLDPTNGRGSTDQPGYLPPVAIGETMRGLGMGRVVETDPQYEEGQLSRA